MKAQINTALNALDRWILISHLVSLAMSISDTHKKPLSENPSSLQPPQNCTFGSARQGEGSGGFLPELVRERRSGYFGPGPEAVGIDIVNTWAMKISQHIHGWFVYFVWWCIVFPFTVRCVSCTTRPETKSLPAADQGVTIHVFEIPVQKKRILMEISGTRKWNYEKLIKKRNLLYTQRQYQIQYRIHTTQSFRIPLVPKKSNTRKMMNNRST